MISAVFVDRPRLAIVIAIIITIAGGLSMLRIPVAQFPDIVPPQVQVTANYPGASAAVVEASVAQPIEAQVIGVDKMLYMKSTNGNDGSYNLTVSFELGTNPDIDTVNVNNRVQTALSQLPAIVQLQGLTVQKRSSAILEFISLYSENGAQDPLFITNYATINVLDEISRLPGVGQANLFSKLNYSMRIWFDTNRLTSLNLSPSDIVTAIQSQNVVAPIGRIGARPAANDVQFQLNLQTQGRLTTPEQFGDIVVRANPDGSVLKVKDVARVELGAKNQDSESRLNGKPSVAMAIYLAPGSNAVNTAAAVNRKLAELSQRFPEGLKSQVNYDSTTFVTDTIGEVEKTLAEAFVLVIVVVFLFLGNLRATLIPTIAVPVSLIGAFAGLLTLGYSANTVSLLALVLAIGIVVDDAIVVVENVERVMEENPDLSPKDATKLAMQQITAPIIAITLVLLSVFIPIAFIPGISGQLFRQFAVTISVSVVISAINALTLSPALCAVFLRHSGPKRGVMAWVMRRIDGVRDGYANLVSKTLRLSVIGVVLAVAFGGGIFGLALHTPTGFLPSEDQGGFFVAVQLPDGASVARTSNVVRQVEGITKNLPGVSDTFAIIGFSLLDSAQESNAAFMFIKLKPFEDRTAAAEKAQALIGRLFGAVQQVKQATVFPFNLPPIIGLSTTGGFEYQLEALQGQDAVTLGQAMNGLLGAANSDPRLTPGVLHLYRHQPVIVPGHRPAEDPGPGPVHAGCVHGAPGDPGRHLHQRLQPVRPHLAGEHPGRSLRPQQRRRPVEDLRQEQDGPGSAATRVGEPPGRAGAAGHHALQQLPLDHHQRRSGGGRVVRRGAFGDGGGVRPHPATGLCLRMDGHGLPGSRGPGPDRRHPRAGHPVRLPLPGRAL